MEARSAQDTSARGHICVRRNAGRRAHGRGHGFFEQVRLGAYVVLLSDETQRELAASPEAVQDVWLDLPPASVELIGLDDEARSLADEHVDAEVLGEASIADALHVAAANADL